MRSGSPPREAGKRNTQKVKEYPDKFCEVVVWAVKEEIGDPATSGRHVNDPSGVHGALAVRADEAILAETPNAVVVGFHRKRPFAATKESSGKSRTRPTWVVSGIGFAHGFRT